MTQVCKPCKLIPSYLSFSGTRALITAYTILFLTFVAHVNASCTFYRHCYEVGGNKLNCINDTEPISLENDDVDDNKKQRALQYMQEYCPQYVSGGSELSYLIFIKVEVQ